MIVIVTEAERETGTEIAVTMIEVRTVIVRGTGNVIIRIKITTEIMVMATVVVGEGMMTERGGAVEIEDRAPVDPGGVAEDIVSSLLTVRVCLC